MSDWYKDDDFWVEFYHHIFCTKKETAAPQQVEQVQNLTGVTSGRLLDIPCGPGRHAVPFAAEGFAVTGLDINANLLARAEKRATAAGVSVEWLEGDMRTFVREGEYDLAICMFNSLGYFETDADDIQVLANLRRSLKPGGKLLLELVSKEYLARIFTPHKVSTAVDGSVVEQFLTITEDWSRLQNRWVMKKADGETQEYSFTQTIFSAREIKWLLNQAGFKRLEVFGDLTGRPYDYEATRLVVVGTTEG